MTQDHTPPVPRRALVAVPVSGPAPVPPVPDAGTEGSTAPVPVLPARGVPMTVPERAGTAVRRWGGTALNAAAELWLHPGKVIHKLVHAAPEPIRAHLGYVKSGEWVPRELRGTKAGKAITFSGWAYHVLFAIPADKALQGLEAGARKARWAVQRPLRLLGFLIPCIVILLIVI